MVQLKLKMADFTLLTRQVTLPAPTDDGQAIYQAASGLLRAERLVGKLRLTGVSAQGLTGGAQQLALFATDRRVGNLNAVLDRIADKFGEGIVTTADLTETPARRRS